MGSRSSFESRARASAVSTRSTRRDTRISTRADGPSRAVSVIRGPLKVYDTTPALIGGLFAQQQGRLLDYSRRVYELFFRRELEVDQPDAVATVIASLGMSADSYRKYLSGDGALAYQRAQDEAANDHVFGVPLFFFEGEPFWGHDRIPILEDRLTEAGSCRSDSLLHRWRRVRVEDQLLCAIVRCRSKHYLLCLPLLGVCLSTSAIR